MPKCDLLGHRFGRIVGVGGALCNRIDIFITTKLRFVIEVGGGGDSS